MENQKRDTKIITISMNAEDLKEIDLYCMAHNLTRSKFMVQCAIQSLEMEKVYNATVVLNRTLSGLAEKGYIDAKDKSVIEAVKVLERAKRA